MAPPLCLAAAGSQGDPGDAVLIGTFGLNFPIFISTMAVSVFHAGAQEYGVLTSIMAIGSVASALMSAGRS